MSKKKYTQGPDGYYRTKAWDGTYNPDGTKRRIHLSSKKSSADLEKQVNALKNQIANRQITQPTDNTVLEYARAWLKTYKAVRETNTRTMYENIIEKHLIALENVRLQDLDRNHFQLVINNALDHPRTCQQIALTFKQIVKSAIRAHKLPAGAYNDICLDIDIPRYQKTPKRALTETEKAAMRTADFTDRERCFVYLIYGCGLRREEALALTPADIILSQNTLRINRSLIFNGNEPEIKGPKSSNGRREIHMPSFLTDFLRGYIPGLRGDYLIGTMDGSIITKSSYRKMWDSIVKKMNHAAGGTDNVRIIHNLTAHTFRHNYCTMLCYQIPTISIQRIATLLGDDKRMVLDVYSHIVEAQENSATAVENAVGL